MPWYSQLLLSVLLPALVVIVAVRWPGLISRTTLSASDSGRLTQQVQTLTEQVETLMKTVERLGRGGGGDVSGETQLAYPVSEGSVYVRWGSSSCPHSAEMVYSGVAGGGHFQHKGAGVNPLCLPPNPLYDDQHRTTAGSVYLYGAEYETDPEPSHDWNVVCAVCVSRRQRVLMIPGTAVCQHAGWNVEYSGHLMSGHHTHAAATEYVCVDSAMETAPGSGSDQNGKLFYYVVGQCGSLPCPPYHHDKVLTCVVCSK